MQNGAMYKNAWTAIFYLILAADDRALLGVSIANVCYAVDSPSVLDCEINSPGLVPWSRMQVCIGCFVWGKRGSPPSALHR